MFLETFQDHPRVEGGAFEGGEELVLRRVHQLPPERDPAEFGVHQHRPVPVIPGKPQKAGLSGAVGFQAAGELSSRWRLPASRWRPKCAAGP